MFVESRTGAPSGAVDNALAFNDNGLEEDLPALHELLYLRRGLSQAGGKLRHCSTSMGESINVAIVKKCSKRGWGTASVQQPAEA